nr:hypothetical protein [uncultured Micrococcus sp.]
MNRRTFIASRDRWTLVAWLARLRREHLERIHAASLEREAPTDTA